MCGGLIEGAWQANHVLAHGAGGGATEENYLPVHTDLFGDEQSIEMLYVFSHADSQRAEGLCQDPHAGGRFYWELYGDYMDTNHDDATVNGIADGRSDIEALIEARGQDALFEQLSADARIAVGWRSHAGPLQDYRGGFTAEVRGGWALRDLAAQGVGLEAVPDLNGETSTPTSSSVPGYTTKGVGVGTGLGLSICYQIMQDHDGRIDVASKVGKGTTITIVVPIAPPGGGSPADAR